MRRFKFRFEAVEKVRRNREQQVLRLLGAAQRDVETAQARKARLIERLQKALSEREGLGQTPVLPSDFAVLEAHISGTKTRIVQAEHAIQRANRALEKAKRVYLQARRQLKAIETLRERHYSEWHREGVKKEQARLDDLITTRFVYLKEAE